MWSAQLLLSVRQTANSGISNAQGATLGFFAPQRRHDAPLLVKFGGGGMECGAPKSENFTDLKKGISALPKRSKTASMPHSLHQFWEENGEMRSEGGKGKWSKGEWRNDRETGGVITGCWRFCSDSAMLTGLLCRWCMCTI